MYVRNTVLCIAQLVFCFFILLFVDIEIKGSFVRGYISGNIGVWLLYFLLLRKHGAEIKEKLYWIVFGANTTSLLIIELMKGHRQVFFFLTAFTGLAIAYLIAVSNFTLQRQEKEASSPEKEDNLPAL